MKKKKIAILFTCVGRRVSLLRSFRRQCRSLGCDSVIIGTDTTEDSAALQCCDLKYIVKPVCHRDYGREITEIIRDNNVDILIPTVDLDLAIWSRRRGKLGQMGCTALISSSKVVRVCQDKRLTFEFLKQHGFDTPQTFSPDQAIKDGNYPYFAKPWDGHASRGSQVVRNREELEFFAGRIPNCIVQEFIDGDEYTVDVLVDFDGQVRCVVPRLRIETRGGEVSKGRTVKNTAIIEQSRALSETLGAGPGIVTIQCFLAGPGKDTRKRKLQRKTSEPPRIKFIEINPRFGGGVPLSIKAGANFPRWILQLWLGQSPRIPMAGWRDGLTMLRYDDAVWL